MDFEVAVKQRGKIKENEKMNKYLDLLGELNDLADINVIPIAVGAFGMVLKSLEKRLKELEVNEESRQFRPKYS